MIKLGIVDQYWGFENSLIVDLIRSIAGEPVVITEPRRCDLLIVGPFRPPASLLTRAKARLKSAWGRDPWATRTYRPVIVFQNWENLRHDHIPADFSISSDLNVSSDKHLRLPYWLSQIDWSHEGLPVRHSPRVGRALSIERLMKPLGSAFLVKPKRAVLITSHMLEPRQTLFDTLSKFMQVDGYGPAFDKTVLHHDSSPFVKEDVLNGYAYSLCPENSFPSWMHPCCRHALPWNLPGRFCGRSSTPYADRVPTRQASKTQAINNRSARPRQRAAQVDGADWRCGRSRS